MTEEKLREIDRLVAEKVMGWLLDDSGWWCDSKSYSITHQRNFNPATNPADSKMVRDKLAERFMYVRVDTCTMDGKRSYICRAWDVLGPDPNFGCRVEASTEELAVALCALRSVGVEVEL